MKKLLLMAALFCFAAAPAAMAQNYETPQNLEQQQNQYAKDAPCQCPQSRQDRGSYGGSS